MDCFGNLDRLLGRFSFRCIGIPLKTRGGTATAA